MRHDFGRAVFVLKIAICCLPWWAAWQRGTESAKSSVYQGFKLFYVEQPHV